MCRAGRGHRGSEQASWKGWHLSRPSRRVRQSRGEGGLGGGNSLNKGLGVGVGGCHEVSGFSGQARAGSWARRRDVPSLLLTPPGFPAVHPLPTPPHPNSGPALRWEPVNEAGSLPGPQGTMVNSVQIRPGYWGPEGSLSSPAQFLSLPEGSCRPVSLGALVSSVRPP